MRHTLLFVTLFLLTSSAATAQCGSIAIVESPDAGSDDNSSSSGGPPPSFDLEGSPFRKGSFISFGPYSILPGVSHFSKASEQNHYRIGNMREDWKDLETGGFFEMGFGLSSDKYGVIGFTINSMTLWNRSSSAFQQAPDIEPQQQTSSRVEAEPTPGKSFTWHFVQKAAMRNFAIFAEHALFEKKGFRIFGRGDIGLTKNVAKASINYLDDCGCTQILKEEKKREFVPSANAGIGVAYNFGFIGLRVLLGHQWQRASSFYTNDDLKQWTAHFDEKNADFSRNPDSKNFYINTPKSKQHLALKNNFQYLQIGMTMNIGRSQ